MGRAVVYEHDDHEGMVYASLAALGRTRALVLSPDHAKQLGVFLLDMVEHDPGTITFLAQCLINTGRRIQEQTPERDTVQDTYIDALVKRSTEPK